MQWRHFPPVIVALVVFVQQVAAHDPPDSRFQSPIPLELLFLGAVAAVGATAVVLALGDASSRNRRLPSSKIPLLVGRMVATASRIAFAGTVTWVVFVGLFGDSTVITTPFVWVLWLKGIGLVAALLGNPWRRLSPWRAVYDLGEPTPRRDYPKWLGRWPAVAGFLLVAGIAENLTGLPADPQETALLVVGYALVMLVGATIFGREWFENADFFEVLYSLFGRVAPVTIDRTSGAYRVQLRPPWAGCTRPVADLATVTFVVATVYIVSFDGFMGTIKYDYLLGSVYALADSGSLTEPLTYVLGFLVFIAGYGLVVGLSERLGGSRFQGGLLALAPTLLPIAVGYEIAHTYPLLVREIVTVTAAVPGICPFEPLAWLSVPAFWGSQVLLIIVGHVVAVVAVNRVTARRYQLPARGHIPFTALMAGYTVLSLWVISLPVVR